MPDEIRQFSDFVLGQTTAAPDDTTRKFSDLVLDNMPAPVPVDAEAREIIPPVPETGTAEATLVPSALDQLTESGGLGLWTGLHQATQKLGFGHIHFEQVLGDEAAFRDLREGALREYRGFLQQSGPGLPPLLTSDMTDRLKTAFAVKELIRRAPLDTNGAVLAADSAMKKTLRLFVERQKALEAEGPQAAAQAFYGGTTVRPGKPSGFTPEQEESLKFLAQLAPKDAMALSQEAWDAVRSPYPKFVRDNITILSKPVGLVTGQAHAERLFGSQWAEVLSQAYDDESTLLKESLVRARFGPTGAPESLRGYTWTPDDGIRPLELLPRSDVQTIVEEAQRRRSPAFGLDRYRYVPADRLVEPLVESVGREVPDLPEAAVTPAERELAGRFTRWAVDAQNFVNNQLGAIPRAVEALDRRLTAMRGLAWDNPENRANRRAAIEIDQTFKRLEDLGIEVDDEHRNIRAPFVEPTRVSLLESVAFLGRMAMSNLPGVYARAEALPDQALPALQVDRDFRQEALRVINPVYDAVVGFNNTFRHSLDQKIRDDERARTEHVNNPDMLAKDPRVMSPLVRMTAQAFKPLNWGVDHFVIQPLAALVDEPALVARFITEDAILGAAMGGSMRAVGRLQSLMSNANAAKNVLGQLATRSPLHARKIRDSLARRLAGSADPHQELESLVAHLDLLTEEAAETAVRTDPWTLGNQLRKHWPELRADLGVLGSDVEGLIQSAANALPSPLSQPITRFVYNAKRAGHKLTGKYPVFADKVTGMVDNLIARDLNNEALQVVDGLLRGGGETGFRRLHGAQRLRMFAEATGQRVDDIPEAIRLRVIAGDRQTLAAVEPKIQTQLAALDEQIARFARDGNTADLADAVRQRERAGLVLEQWKDAVPSKESLTMLDIYRTVERTRVRSRSFFGRAADEFYRRLFKVSKVEADGIYKELESLVHMTLEGSENLLNAGRRLAEKRILSDRLYRLAAHKARQRIENLEIHRAWLEEEAFQAGTRETTDRIQQALLEADQRLAATRAAQNRLTRERGVLNDTTPERRWAVPQDAELRQWVNDSDLYWMLKTEPRLGNGALAEELFDIVPGQPAARVSKTGQTKRLERLEGLMKRTMATPPRDSMTEALRLRAEVAAASERRVTRPEALDLKARKPRTIRGLLGNKNLESFMTPAERRVAHAAVRHVNGPVTTDGFGRPVGLLAFLDSTDPFSPRHQEVFRAMLPKRLLAQIDKLDTPLGELVARPTTRLARAARRHVERRLQDMIRDVSKNADLWPRAGLITRAQAAQGRLDEWDAFYTASQGMDNAQRAAQDFAGRREALVTGTVPFVEEERMAAISGLEVRTRRLRQQLKHAGPEGQPRLTEAGRAWLENRLQHGGLDDVTQPVGADPFSAVVARTRAARAGLQGFVDNRISRFALELPFLPLAEKIRFLGQARSHVLGQQALRAVHLDDIAKIYSELDDESLDVLGAALKAKAPLDSVVESNPELGPLVDKIRGRVPDIDEVLTRDDGVLTGIIEKLHQHGMIDEGLRRDMIAAGYEPQRHMHHELPSRVRSKDLDRLRANRQRPSSPGAGPELDALELRRSIGKFRMRYRSPSGAVQNYEFTTWEALQRFADKNFGSRVRSGLKRPKTVERFSTSFGEDVTVTAPLGTDILDPILGPGTGPLRRLDAVRRLSHDIALVEYLDSLRFAHGLVLDEGQLRSLQLENGAAGLKAAAGYKKLPDNKRRFGNLAGSYVHETVFKELQAASRSYNRLSAWVDGLREAFISEGTEPAASLLSAAIGRTQAAARVLDRAFRTGQITLSVGTRIANRAFGFVTDHLLGTNMYSAKNLDIAEEASRIFGARGGRVGPLPDEAKEFIQLGLSDQSLYGASGLSRAEVRAMDRMVGIEDIDLRKAKRLLAASERKLRRIREAGPGVDTSGLEAEVLAANAIVDQLEEGWLRRAAGDFAAFFGNPRRRAIPSSQTSIERFMDWAKESYSAVDTMNKYRAYAIMRRKMGIDQDTAAELVRMTTQQYQSLPPALHTLQQSAIGAAVVGFPYEATRILAMNARNNGLRTASLFAILPALNFAAAAGGGTDPERFYGSLETMTGGSRAALAKALMSQFHVFSRGDYLLSVNLGNLTFPFVETLLGQNPVRHIFDQMVLGDETKRGVLEETLGIGASLAGAFFLNKPMFGAFMGAVGIDARTGRRIFNEGGSIWDKAYGVYKSGLSAYVSPHAPIVGRGWRALRDAYNVGFDPATGRPIGPSPVELIIRQFTGVGVRGVPVAAADELFGNTLRRITDALTVPGGRESFRGRLAPRTVADDRTIWRNIVSQLGRQGKEDVNIESILASSGRAARQLWARYQIEDDPNLRNELLQTLAKEGGEARIAGRKIRLGPTTVTELSKALDSLESSSWLDAFDRLDIERQAWAIAIADRQGVDVETLRAAARQLQRKADGTVQSPDDPEQVRRGRQVWDLAVRAKASRLHELHGQYLLPWSSFWEAMQARAHAKAGVRNLRADLRKRREEVLNRPGLLRSTRLNK